MVPTPGPTGSTDDDVGGPTAGFTQPAVPPVTSAEARVEDSASTVTTSAAAVIARTVGRTVVRVVCHRQRAIAAGYAARSSCGFRAGCPPLTGGGERAGSVP